LSVELSFAYHIRSTHSTFEDCQPFRAAAVGLCRVLQLVRCVVHCCLVVSSTGGSFGGRPRSNPHGITGISVARLSLDAQRQGGCLLGCLEALAAEISGGLHATQCTNSAEQPGAAAGRTHNQIMAPASSSSCHGGLLDDLHLCAAAAVVVLGQSYVPSPASSPHASFVHAVVKRSVPLTPRLAVLLLHLLPPQLTAAVPAGGHPGGSRCGGGTRTAPYKAHASSSRRLAEAPSVSDSTPPDEATSAAVATLGTDDVLGAQPSTPAVLPTTGPEVQGVCTKPSTHQSLNPESAHSQGPHCIAYCWCWKFMCMCTASSMHLQQTEWMVG